MYIIVKQVIRQNKISIELIKFNKQPQTIQMRQKRARAQNQERQMNSNKKISRGIRQQQLQRQMARQLQLEMSYKQKAYIHEKKYANKNITKLKEQAKYVLYPHFNNTHDVQSGQGNESSQNMPVISDNQNANEQANRSGWDNQKLNQITTQSQILTRHLNIKPEPDDQCQLQLDQQIQRYQYKNALLYDYQPINYHNNRRQLRREESEMDKKYNTTYNLANNYNRYQGQRIIKNDNPLANKYYNKIDIKSIIRMQNLEQKKQLLKKSYVNNSNERKVERVYKSCSNTKNINGSTSGTKKQYNLDMIIPSLQAFNINSLYLSGFNQYADQAQINDKTKTKKSNLDLSRTRSYSQNKQIYTFSNKKVTVKQTMNVTTRLREKMASMIQKQQEMKFKSQQKQKQQAKFRSQQNSIQIRSQREIANKGNKIGVKQRNNHKQQSLNQIYWKQRGKPYRQRLTSPQKKQHIKFRSKNVQSIIRRKSIIDFDQAIKQYCRRMKMDQQSKIFVFNSSDKWLKQCLMESGWIINHDNLSKLYHLKWTYKISNQKQRAYKNQLVNHFYQSDLLTSKVQLSNTIKMAIQNPHLSKQEAKYLNRFYPKTYDLRLETNQFISNFHTTQILCGFKKVISQIQKYYPSDHLDVKQIIVQNKLGELLKQMIQNQYFQHQEQQNNDFVVHIPYAVQLCAFCQNIRCNIEDIQNQEQYKLNEKTLKNLLNFSFLNPPYHQYVNTNSSDNTASQLKLVMNSQKKQTKIRFSKDNINLYSSAISFKRPSQFLVRLMYGYHLYLCENYNTYEADGINNVWIIKNRNSSKGSGINLSNNLQQILKKTENKLVQKYIQNCSLYKIHQKQLPKQEYKYDLRVWVLVTSFKPLIAYYYNQFYCRLCSQTYNLDNLNQLQSHLTNYTKNKQTFALEGRNSILTYPQFIELIKNQYSLDPPKIKQMFNQKIHNLVYHTLKLYQNKIQSNPQCFQLYGFDILVSNSLDLYLLQVNLSPACQDRNQWLSQNVRKMAKELLNIVVKHQRPNSDINLQGWCQIKPV